MSLKKIRQKSQTARRVFQDEGVTGMAIKGLEKLQSRRQQSTAKKDLTMLVKLEDVLEADWSQKRLWKKPGSKKHYTVNWVMSPPGKGSGGHQNLFRFIHYLEKAGHTCRIYLYSTADKRSVAEVKEVLKDSYDKTKASIEWLKGDMAPADAIFATGWETAYPVFNAKTDVQRLYFVQDFEPFFYPTGSETVLAENTYRFNFYGVTAGGWLAKKLNRDYGMQTDYFNFGANTDLYTHTNHSERKEVFFYARPVTARRGFELGILALDLFHQQHPEYTINLAGWDVSDYDIPFPYKNLKTLTLAELPELYNRCSAALVLSLTNLSLLPLELLACGTIPVVNDGENNRLVSDNPYISYVPNSPAALARALSKAVSREDAVTYANKASASVQSASWDEAGAKFVKIVEGALHNG